MVVIILHTCNARVQLHKHFGSKHLNDKCVVYLDNIAFELQLHLDLDNIEDPKIFKTIKVKTSMDLHRYFPIRLKLTLKL